MSKLGNLTVGTVWHVQPNAENIYIGRNSKGNSILHNPYVIKTSRDIACDNFRVYLYKELANKDSIVCKEMTRIAKLLMDGVDVNLQCFCTHKKLRCHGQEIEKVLLAAINRKITNA